MNNADKLEKLHNALQRIFKGAGIHDIIHFDTGTLQFHASPDKMFGWILRRERQEDTVYASSPLSIIFDPDYIRLEDWPEDTWDEFGTSTKLDVNTFLADGKRAVSFYPTYINLYSGERETLTDAHFAITFIQGED